MTARWLRRGNRRRAVLRALRAAGSPLTATELSAILHVSMKRASETLRELAARTLAELVDPDRPSRRRYRITCHGVVALTWIARCHDTGEPRPSVDQLPASARRQSGSSRRNRL